MVKTVNRPLKTKLVNIKLTDEQYEDLQMIALAEGDGNMSSVVRRWIIKEIRRLESEGRVEPRGEKRPV